MIWHKTVKMLMLKWTVDVELLSLNQDKPKTARQLLAAVISATDARFTMVMCTKNRQFTL